MTSEEKIVDILEKQGKTLENLQAGQERLEKTVGTLQEDVKDIKQPNRSKERRLNSKVQ